MVDRIDCAHFEYKYLLEKGKRVKIPTCKIGKMKGTKGCQEYCEYNFSAYIFFKQGENLPPNPPSIDGPKCGKPNTEYDFTFVSTDPEDDTVMYIINWGDNNTEFSEYNDSGDEILLKHTWTEKGTYVIKAQTLDIHGAESEWSEFTVTMPRDKAINKPFLNWLQSHPNLFPLLQKLIQQLGL